MSNKLQLTVTALNAAKDLKEMFDMEPVKYNAVNNLMKTRGITEEKAMMHYEREKILFFKALQSNKALEKCDRFSIYSCWIELFASGLTLNDGFAYIIPYGKQAQFQPGWKGRLDQMGTIPEIENIPPPQVVYENDEFDYELGDYPRIIKHKPTKGDRGQIACVYLVIQKSSGKELHLMTRAEVLAIRDRYSKTYNQYIADCKATNTEIGKPVKKTGNYGDYTIEPPMWITSEDQAFKKTLVKRAWNSQANKTARMRALDQKVAKNFDPEDATGGDQTTDIDYGIVDDGRTEQQSETKQEEQQDLGNLNEAF
jgi:phage RecT family recombinase